MNVRNVSFTSNINFVDLPSFYNVENGEYVGFSDNPGDPNSIRKADEFYTYGVRTCTAGGLIDSSNDEAVGFHYYDGPKNNAALTNYVDSLFKNVKNPDKALILGGKTLQDSPYSMEQFLKIKELLSKRVDNVTVFEEHTFPWSESHLHYSLPKDTWTIRTMYRPLTDWREYSVLSKDELQKVFKKVEISPEDKLMINSLDVIV